MSFDLLYGLSPILVVVLGGSLLMLAEAFGRVGHSERHDPTEEKDGRSTGELGLIAAVILFAGALFSVSLWMYGPERIAELKALAPYLVMDRFTLFFSFVLCMGAGISSLFAAGYLPEHRIERGEFYALLVFATVGAMLLVASGDLLSLFVSLETMSLAVYCMTGFRRGSPRSTEAAVKYFLLGSFAAALLVYGGALIYGATGHTDLAGIRAGLGTIATAGVAGKLGLAVVGMVLILVGLAFKVSAVPFHMWTPDAYEGAPTPATSFMAVAVKSAAFAVLLRVLLVGFGDERAMSWGAGWPPVMAVLAILTMTVANLTAGRQESVKRMLAFSSVAHAGYVLVALAATVRASADAQASVLFYLLAYTFSTAGAFGALILIGSRGKEAVTFEDLAGVGRRHPAAALAMSLFMLSLTGVPPTAGFFAKLYILKAAIGADLYVLAIVLALNSVLAAYYYLRVLVYMYMREPAPGAPLAVPMKSGHVSTALVLASIFVLVLGLTPGSSLELALRAALG